jgi:hypothetical protein
MSERLTTRRIYLASLCGVSVRGGLLYDGRFGGVLLALMAP